MCNSQTANEELNETTNVGLVNVSENNKSLVGIAEILMGIILAILLWLVFKWCCKCHRRSTEQRESNLEQMIQRERPFAPIQALPALPQVPAMVPTVSFEHPGERVVYMKHEGSGSEWDRCK